MALLLCMTCVRDNDDSHWKCRWDAGVCQMCLTSWLCDVWMAVLQLMSATEAVHCLAAVVIHWMSVKSKPLAISPVTDWESSSVSCNTARSVKFTVFSLKSTSLLIHQQYILACKNWWGAPWYKNQNWKVSAKETKKALIMWKYKRVPKSVGFCWVSAFYGEKHLWQRLIWHYDIVGIWHGFGITFLWLVDHIWWWFRINVLV